MPVLNDHRNHHLSLLRPHRLVINRPKGRRARCRATAAAAKSP
jgi:hypothetical protein